MKRLLMTDVNEYLARVYLNELVPDEFGEYRVHISGLYATVKGGGASNLTILCRNADGLGITLSLNAYPMISSAYPIRWSEEQLVSWYMKWGFEKRRTANPTFNYMSNLMVRTPIKPVLARP